MKIARQDRTYLQGRKMDNIVDFRVLAEDLIENSLIGDVSFVKDRPLA